MATLQDYITVKVQEGNEQDGIQKLNEAADNGYFVVDKLHDSTGEHYTTFLLSQYQPVNEKRDPDSNNVHTVIEDNIATEDFILLDLSDTANYPHNFTDFLDLEAVNLYIDATSNATFSIQLGFLEDVDGTDGRFIEVMRTESNNQSGVEHEVDAMFAGIGGQLREEDWLSSNEVADAAFANTNQLASTLDPNTANVAPDTGDLILRMTRENTENVSVFITLVYKSN